MDRAEQANGEERDWRTDSSHQSVYRAETGAAVWIINSLAEHEIRNIDQLGDRCSSKTRIPRPPCIPGRPRPYGAKHDGDQKEYQAHLNCRDLKAIPFQVFYDEIDHAEYCRKDEAEQRSPRGANVEVKHTLHVSHHQFGRRS